MRQLSHVQHPAAVRGGWRCGRVVAASLAVLGLLAVGCGGGSGSGTVDRLDRAAHSASAPVPTPAARSAGGIPAAPAVPDSGQQGAVARQLLATYQGWWEAQIEAFSQSSGSGIGLGLFSTGQALSDALANLHRLQEAGMVMQGRPRTDARVTTLDLESGPQTATIEDCLDVSGWHQADAGTGQVKDPQQRPTRYPVTATARSTGTAWLITQLKSETGQTC